MEKTNTACGAGPEKNFIRHLRENGIPKDSIEDMLESIRRITTQKGKNS